MQHRRWTILAPPVAIGLLQVVERFEQRRLIRDLGRTENHAQESAQIDVAGREVPVDGGREGEMAFDREPREPLFLD